jgi:hypothetical protein
VELCIPTLRDSARASTCVGSRNHALSSGSSIGLTAPYFHMPLCRRGGSRKRCSDRGISLPGIAANMNLIDMIYQIAVTIDASAFQADGNWINAWFENSWRAGLMKRKSKSRLVGYAAHAYQECHTAWQASRGRYC